MGTVDFSESLFRADHSSRGIVQSVVVKPRQLGGPGLLGAVAPWEGGGGVYSSETLVNIC